jgi:hypothetical protein
LELLRSSSERLVHIRAIIYTSLPEDDLIRESKQFGEKLKDFTFTVYAYAVGCYYGSLNLFGRSRDDLMVGHNLRLCLYFTLWVKTACGAVFLRS